MFFYKLILQIHIFIKKFVTFMLYLFISKILTDFHINRKFFTCTKKVFKYSLGIIRNWYIATTVNIREFLWNF